MGRRSTRPGKGPSKRAVQPSDTWDGMEHNEVDTFNENRDRIALSDFDYAQKRKGTHFDEEYDEFEDSDEEVFGIKGQSSDSEDYGEDDVEEEFSEDDEDVPSDESSDQDDHPETREGTSGWGRRKRSYYHTDKQVLDSSDEEAQKDEEEEALRLQREKLQGADEADFFLDDDDDGDESMPIQSGVSNELDQPLIHRAKQVRSGQDRLVNTGTGVDQSRATDRLLLDDLEAQLQGDTLSTRKSQDSTVIRLDRTRQSTLAAMSKEEQTRLLQERSPEVIELLTEYRRVWSLVRDETFPWLQKIRSFDVTDPSSFPVLSLWDSLHQVATSYLANITFYLALKSRGKLSNSQLQEHPVVEVLVKLRKLLKKLQAVQEQVADQIDIFKDWISTGGASALDDDMEVDEDIEAETMSVGSMTGSSEEEEDDDDDDASEASDTEPLSLSDHSKMSKSTPKVLRASNGQASSHIDYEPDFKDLSRELSRKSKNRSQTKALAADPSKRKWVTNDDLGELDHLDAWDHEDKVQAKMSLRFHAAQVEQQSQRKEKRLKYTGDVDLPYKDADRPRTIPTSQGDMATDDDDGNDSDIQNALDSLQHSKAQAGQKSKSNPHHERKVDMLLEKFDDPKLEPGERRGINRQILKNKGLIPRRPKVNRNPRVRRRKQYEKATKKLHTIKRTYKPPTSSYGGEASGIKAHISRSVRF
ncbi:something about silencing protein 10 [Dispira parvispora]|uniref:Something about silencing protein 10 n=1 Tax=Dispira parvispora TaxID=1520584 RepID=A0A9W8AZV5_9FUNG|nr:something about silencing protein 10 [Dispira parvispora]